MEKKKSRLQIIKLISSKITGNFGSSILSFVIGLMILKNTNSVFNFGFSQVIGPLVSLLLLPFVGSVTDKYNKKTIVSISQMLSIISLTFYALVLTDDLGKNLIYTYILLVCLKISDKFLNNSFQSATSEMILESDLQKYQSLVQVINSAVGIASPIVAAFLITQLSLVQFVILEIIIEIITMLIVLTIDFKFVKKEKTVNSDVEGLIKLFKEGIRFISKSKLLIFMMIFSALINLNFAVFIIGFPVVLVKQLNFSDNMYAIVISSFSFGTIFSGILLSSREEIKYPLFSATKYVNLLGLVIIALGGILFLTLNTISYFVIFITVGLIFSFLIVLINVPLNVWSLKTIPIEYQGRVFNILDTMSQLLIPLGILIYSFLFENISGNIVFLISGFVIVILTFSIPLIYKIDLKSSTL